MRRFYVTTAITLCLTALTVGTARADDTSKSEKASEKVEKKSEKKNSDKKKHARRHGARHGHGAHQVRSKAVLARFDRDGDGKLDAAELDRVLRAMHARHAGPHGFHAYHGSRGHGPYHMHRGYSRFHHGHHPWYSHGRHFSHARHPGPRGPMAARSGRPPQRTAMRDADSRRGPERERDRERRRGERAADTESKPTDEATRADSPPRESEARTAPRRAERGPARPGRGPGDGSAEARERFQQMMLERFDKDGDGQLSEEERAAAREQMRDFRARRGDRQRGERSSSNPSPDSSD